jgi:hypothetical protein
MTVQPAVRAADATQADQPRALYPALKRDGVTRDAVR